MSPAYARSFERTQQLGVGEMRKEPQVQKIPTAWKLSVSTRGYATMRAADADQ